MEASKNFLEAFRDEDYREAEGYYFDGGVQGWALVTALSEAIRLSNVAGLKMLLGLNFFADETLAEAYQLTTDKKLRRMIKEYVDGS